MPGKRASDSAAEITHWMGVTDTNSAGNIHGGVVMRLADEAAALAAIKHARRRVVTVGMDRPESDSPAVGDQKLARWRAMYPLVRRINGRHRGPSPDCAPGSCSGDVSRRMPAICTNAWPSLV